MPSTGQVLFVLIANAIVILFPVCLGIVVSRGGDGHGVWGTATMALVLTTLGLLLVTAPNSHKFEVVNQVLNGLGLMAIGTAVAIGTCAAALAHAAREGRPIALVALLLLVALPLLVEIAIADVSVLGIGPAADRETSLQLERLAIVLPPIVCAVLAAYSTFASIWTWASRRRAA